MHRLVLIATFSSVWCLAPAAAQEPADQPSEQARPEDRSRQRRGLRRPDGMPPVHDPSTIVKEGDIYRLFSTGRGVPSLYSPDLKNWQRGPSVFDEKPDWVDELIPGHNGRFWAPDVIHSGDRYLVYYSVSTFGKQTSAIALASSPTLNPEDPDYHWTDHGIVVQTDSDSDHNAIDPSVIRTSDGELWMAYGSFWSGLKLVQLDPETGLRIAPDSPIHSLAFNEQIEAPALYERNGFF